MAPSHYFVPLLYRWVMKTGGGNVKGVTCSGAISKQNGNRNQKVKEFDLSLVKQYFDSQGNILENM